MNFQRLTPAGVHASEPPQASLANNATMSESQKLLHEHPSDDSDSEPENVPQRASPQPHDSRSPSSSRAASRSPAPPVRRPNGGFGHTKRVSSFARPREDGTPRTPNRVRFDDDPVRRSIDGGAAGAEWIELEGDDYITSNGHSDGRERVQRLPLLTGIEAPSVTVAEEFNPEDHLESARPRSGMRSAFMNMANSIMWVEHVVYTVCRLTMIVALASSANLMPFATPVLSLAPSS